MNKSLALSTAIDITKAALSSGEISFAPSSETADDLADFIETLAKRLNKIDDQI